MAKGILYVMSTVVPGLIKIGKTRSDQFANRMYTLERNGYSNVTGLKRQFAIEVDDYDEKEQLLDEIFSKSRIENTELFALDLDLIIQLLSSFEGKQIFPTEITKEEIFDTANANWEEERTRLERDRLTSVPDGIYYLNQNRKDFGKVRATMEVKDGEYIVKKGSICAPVSNGRPPKALLKAHIENGILQEDVIVNSPSIAGWIPLGKSNNGWIVWKDSNGTPIDQYRK